MEIFIDSAVVNEIKEINSLGFISGVTTNPTLIAKEKADIFERLREISEILEGPINGEVISDDAHDMINEAKELNKINKNIVIKVPMTEEGLKCTYQLSKIGIKTNVTLIFSAQQALLAARAGATYVSLFIGRLYDNGIDGNIVLKEVVEIYRKFDIKTKIIAASIRNILHIKNSAVLGCDIATVPYNVLKKCINHFLTTEGVVRFKKDYENSKF